MAIALRPLAQERREVARVAGDEDPVLAGSECEDLRIVECTQRGIGREAHHVVTALGQDRADAFGGQVGVEEQPHPSVARDRNERVQKVKVGHCGAVLGNRGVDLIRVGLSVGNGDPNLGRGQRRIGQQSLG